MIYVQNLVCGEDILHKPQQVLKINHFWVFIDAIFKSLLLVFRYYRNVWLKFFLYVLSKIQFLFLDSSWNLIAQKLNIMQYYYWAIIISIYSYCTMQMHNSLFLHKLEKKPFEKNIHFVKTLPRPIIFKKPRFIVGT